MSDNIWSRKGNTLLYGGEDVGMIGWCNKSDKIKVDMISYEHTYSEDDIKSLGEYMWFLGVNTRINTGKLKGNKL